MRKPVRFGLLFVGILAWATFMVVGEAPASEHSIEVVASDYSGTTPLVEGTYDEVKAELAAFTTGTKAIALPGVTGMDPVTVSPDPFVFDDVGFEITITGATTVLGTAADTTLTATWGDADTDTAPEMVFEVTWTSLQLSAINPAWELPDDINPGLDSATITMDADGTTFSAEVVVQDLLGTHVTAALGLAETDAVTFTGDFDLDWGILKGDFSETSFTVSTSFPLPGNDLFPDWITPGPIDLEIGFDAGNLAVTLGTSLALDDGPTVTVAGTVVYPDRTLELVGTYTWDNAFGVDWLDLDGSLTLEFGPDGISVTLTGSLIQGVTISVTVDVMTDGTLRLTVALENDITLGDILTTFGLDLSGTLPSFILNLGASDVTVSVTVFPTGGFVFSGLADFGVKLAEDGPTFGSKLYFSLDQDGTELIPTVGIRLDTDDEILLSDILDGLEVPEELDFPLVGDAAQLGAVFSTTSWSNSSDNEDDATREFFAPLYGKEPTDTFDIDVVGGFGIIAHLELPGDLGQLVLGMGMDVGVHVVGSLPLFDPDDPLSLTMELTLAPDLPPAIDYIEETSLFLELAAHPTDAKVEMTVGGNVTFRLPAGMPAPLADGLNALGVPVTSAAPVSNDENADPALLPVCDNGNQPRWGWQVQLEDLTDLDGAEFWEDWYGWYCYDLLSMTVEGSIAASTDGLSLSFSGTLLSLNGDPDDGTSAEPWNPLGLQWIGLSQLTLEISVVVGPDGMPGIEFGFLGSAEVGDPSNTINGLVAGRFGATALPAPPFVKPSFDGFRFTTTSGVGLQDLVDVVNAFIAPVDPNATIPALGPDTFPDVAIFNVDLSLGLSAVDSLCIPQGLIVAGELYINPTVTIGNPPQCLDGELTPSRDAQATTCLDKKDEGCFASVDFELSNTGIKAAGQLAGLDLGIVAFDDASIDLAIGLEDPHFKVYGGVDVYNLCRLGPNPTCPEPLMSGDLAMAIDAAGIDLYGALNIFGFSSVIDGRATLGFLTGETPGASLHVLLAAADVDFGQPDWAGMADEVLVALLEEIRKPLRLLDGLASDIIAGKPPYDILSSLDTRFAEAGIDVPTWLQPILDGFQWILDRPIIRDALDALGVGTNALIDVVLNGYEGTFLGVPGEFIPKERTCVGVIVLGKCIGFWANPVCFGLEVDSQGRCWLIPPVVIDIPGVCDVWLPESSFPGVRNDQGKCTLGGVLEGAIEPLAEDAIEVLLPGDQEVDLGKMKELLLSGDGPLLEFTCAELDFELGTEEQSFGMAIDMEVLGTPIEAGFQFDFSNPIVSAGNIILSILFPDQYPQTKSCSGVVETELFDLNRIGEARLGLQPLGTADEGSTLTARGTYSQDGPAEGKTISIDWGDGTTGSKSVTAGTTAFTATHVFRDEGTYRVTFNDGTGFTSEVVTIRNVDPEVGIISPVQVAEAASVVVSIPINDPGLDDEHTVLISWGDGGQTTLNHPVTTASHTYVDDNPTGTTADDYIIGVTVLDGDGGSGQASAVIEVLNVAPSDIAITPHVVYEGEFEPVTVTFTDPGTADIHTVEFDWNFDGSYDSEQDVPTYAREVEVFHRYLDDSQNEPARVKVSDDDGGEQESQVDFTVLNVAPQHLTLIFDPTVDANGDLVTGSVVLDEGDLAELFIAFWDPGILDTHVITVDWGDGSPLTTVNLAADDDTTVSLTHTYVDDNPTTTPTDNYTITVVVEDDDGGIASDQLVVTVNDVAPVISVVDYETDEGTLLTITPTFTDVGLLDTHTATVDWGDGTGVQPTPAPSTNGAGSLSPSHVYADNGVYTVTVTVTDDDSLTTVATLEVDVANVLPETWAGDDQRLFEDDPIVLDPATLHDQGTLDTHTATIDWGDGTPIETGLVTEAPFGPPGSVDGADGTIDGGHVYPHPGIYTVTVCVADDDEPDVPVCDTFQATIVHGFLRMALFGGDGEDPEDGKVKVEHDSSVDGWVGATGDIHLHDRVSVTGTTVSVTGKIVIDAYGVVLGDVIAGTKAELKKWAEVYGAVHAVDEAKLAKTATVTGGVYTGPDAYVFPEITWFDAGIPDQPKDKLTFKRMAGTLPPGDYGKVEVKYGTLELHAGRYLLYELKTSKARLLVDLDPDGDGVAGNLIVLASHKIELDGGVEIVSAVGDASNVIFVTNGDIDLGKDATYAGTFLTDEGKVEVHDDTMVDGALYGQDVKVKHRVAVTYRPAIDAFVDLYVPIVGPGIAMV